MKWIVKQVFVRESIVELNARTRQQALRELIESRPEIDRDLGDGEFELVRTTVRRMRG